MSKKGLAERVKARRKEEMDGIQVNIILRQLLILYGRKNKVLLLCNRVHKKPLDVCRFTQRLHYTNFIIDDTIGW